MKDMAGIAIFTVVLIAAATAVIAQAKHDAIRVLFPIEETEVLTPVDATDELSPVGQYEVE